MAANGDWSADDTIWFSKRVVNSQFVSRIKDVTYDPMEDNVRVSVSLVDTTHPTTDIYIEKQLVEDKRAVYLCVWNQDLKVIYEKKLVTLFETMKTFQKTRKKE